jgi:hypothetical protein
MTSRAFEFNPSSAALLLFEHAAEQTLGRRFSLGKARLLLDALNRSSGIDACARVAAEILGVQLTEREIVKLSSLALRGERQRVAANAIRDKATQLGRFEPAGQWEYFSGEERFCCAASLRVKNQSIAIECEVHFERCSLTVRKAEIRSAGSLLAAPKLIDGVQPHPGNAEDEQHRLRVAGG